MKKQRILFIMMSLYNGGAERSLVNLLQELDPEKFSIDLILIKKEGPFIKELPSYVNLLDTPYSFKKFYSKYQIGLKSTLIFLYKTLATVLSRIFTKNIVEMRMMRWNVFYDSWIEPIEGKYDVAVGYISGETSYFLKKVVADKKIIWVHNDYKAAKYSSKYDGKYFKAADAIVTISSECEAILKDVFPEYQDKIMFIPNISSSKAIRNKANLFFPEEYKNVMVPIIVSIGRLNEQKGFDIAINAASILKKRGVSFQWFIIGDGELRGKLCKLIIENKVEEYVHLLGVKDNPYPYIKFAYVLAQTSRYEGKSVVLDESKIIGTPIVATNYSTVYDQIQDGTEGIVVNMSEVDFANGLERILSDINLQKQIRNNLLSNKYDNLEEVSLYEELFNK